MSARLMPKSACTAGIATMSDHMPMPPTVLRPTLAASRHQAYLESIPRIVLLYAISRRPRPGC